MMNKCLSCYQPLLKGENDFHQACSNRLFGQKTPPIFPYSEEQLEELAEKIIKSHTTITGVQAKLSLHLAKDKNDKGIDKFTIVGLSGGYILKPPSPIYNQLPEVEDLTMHLATEAKINVVPHSLIRLESGNIAYITKRIDRMNDAKIPMEDMCQLTERLTEDKYHGSYEQIAKTITKYSKTPGLDVINYFELVLFCFISGNADMHLKNFSLIQQEELGMVFSPAYDLVNTVLVNPQDKEELALTLNGKKRRIKKSDFEAAFDRSNLSLKQRNNIYRKMFNAEKRWVKRIQQSFLSESFQNTYIELIHERLQLFS